MRRRIPDVPAAQEMLTRIIDEAKMANAIVQEVLEFVRPIRLQVERTAIADVLQNAITLAETKIPRRDITLKVNVDAGRLPLARAIGPGHIFYGLQAPGFDGSGTGSSSSIPRRSASSCCTPAT